MFLDSVDLCSVLLAVDTITGKHQLLLHTMSEPFIKDPHML